MEEIEKTATDIRENLIITAVNFLTNPNVQRSTLQQKQKFLRDKGLTEHEIQIACERAGVFAVNEKSKTNNTHTIINMDRRQSSYIVQPTFKSTSTFGKIKEVLNSMALFSGVAYACYLFYKKFIEPFLFGRKKRKTVEEKLDELSIKVEQDLKSLCQEVNKIKEEIKNQSSTDTFRRELQGFQQDIESIKGLLLNKKQFASPNLHAAPTIPDWQLATRCISVSEDKNDDAGSGSGSSETEVVTKNSDSSLEMM